MTRSLEDVVRDAGNTVETGSGTSTSPAAGCGTSGYTFNDRAMISLGVVDADIGVGDELTLIWGEEGGSTQKTTVERHRQTEIRVRVVPTPYSKMARETYAEGWRTKGT